MVPTLAAARMGGLAPLVRSLSYSCLFSCSAGPSWGPRRAPPWSAAPSSIPRATPCRPYAWTSSDRSVPATSTRTHRAASRSPICRPAPTVCWPTLRASRRMRKPSRCPRPTSVRSRSRSRWAACRSRSSCQRRKSKWRSRTHRRACHVVTAETLRARQIDNFGDALRAVPGLSVARSGGRGALTSLFPRGGESDYTLVLVDGMRLNSFGGGMDLAQLVARQRRAHRGRHGAAERTFRGRRHRWRRPGGHDARWPGASRGARRGRQRIDLAARSPRRRGQRASGTGAATCSGPPATVSRARRRRASRSVTTTGGSDRSPDPSAGKPSPTAFVRLNARRLESERGVPGPYGSDPIGVFPGVDTVSRGSEDDRQIGLAAQHGWGHVLAGRIRQRYSRVLRSSRERLPQQLRHF